jgi:large subunit ribosomal protein L30
MAKEKAAGSQPKITLRLSRSLIGSTERQREVVRGLGLRRHSSVVERDDTPEVRGMIAKVGHLVEIIAPDDAGRRGSKAE